MTVKRFSRRDVLRLGAGSLVAFDAIAASRDTATKPNIIFILADDLGYADLSCYGRREYSTPHIDKLAAQGMRFIQAYANSAVCTATRTALITGRYQYRLPVGLEEPLGFRDVGLPPEHPTLPSLLKKLGYGTTLLGKWHLGSLPKYGPLQSGYDHFFGFRGGGVDYFSHSIGGKDDLWDNDTPVHRVGYLTDLLGDRAIESINAYAKSKQPFFMSLHFSAPHWPWEGPNDEAESQRIRPAPTLMSLDGGSLKTYADMMTRLDMQIGRVLDTLDKRGLSRDTIVIFTSDNGGERFSDTWPFTGKKSELLEGGIRIPAIVRWPTKVRAGLTHNQVIASMDWLPTLLAAASGIPDPAYPSDGMNLLSTLTTNIAPLPRTLFWRYKNHEQQALRDGDWKYLKIAGNTFLFNVVDDPLERANWKQRDAKRYEDLVAKYNAWNATMLPLDPQSNSHGFSGADQADRYGVPEARRPVQPRAEE